MGIVFRSAILTDFAYPAVYNSRTIYHINRGQAAVDMNIRERQEEFEKIYLSPYASLSVNSKGRRRQEEQCSMRPVFQRDRDRILHCKSFRRMKHKTQVFLAPAGDHYRTRLTHTLEVAQIARTIARGIGANEDLTEAIAMDSPAESL